MKNRKFFKSVFALFLAVMMVFYVIPAPAAAASSDQIQEQIDELEKENEAIQAEINALQKGYENITGDIQDIVDKKNAIDQEISLLNTQIVNINDQVAAYGQLVADTQEELEAARCPMQIMFE